jgi:aldehyde dehydrogenase (NAD+)
MSLTPPRRVIATAPRGTPADVAAAVAAARAAFEGPWRTFSATHRGRLLATFAQVVVDLRT